MTDHADNPETPAEDSDTERLRSTIDNLRYELWQREMLIQELESRTVRDAARRSLSFRITAQSQHLDESSLMARTARRVAATVRPTSTARARITELITFPDPTIPAASIVIPVHNQLDATLRCLESIFVKTHDVDYEIIVVDDASDAYVSKELGKVPYIKLISLDENVGYLRATKAGVAAATSEFIVLLNNDTEVLEGWLTALLNTLDDESVGAVGAKLLLPSGDVQEAGAIVWNDGSARHVGRGLDRYHPRVSYARDVDYSSAACLALRRSTWDAVGGFDEHYVPAYYEDVDLCFAVRKLGLRVRYQPAAEVFHHEGTSHGNNEGSGTKRYQKINQSKFRRKWADELTTYEPSTVSESEAMIRAPRVANVLVIDHQAPRPNEDAGSMRMFAILRALTDLGAHVIFATQDEHIPQSDILNLGKYGVEVSSDAYPIHQRISDDGDRIDLIILSRPQVCARYLPELRRKCPNALIAYDTVDLHYLRELRRAPDDATAQQVSNAFFELEQAAVCSTDLTIVVSNDEADHVRAMCSTAKIAVIPTVSDIAEDVPPATARKGIMYLGGFRHPPNIDAAVLLANEILPVLRESFPDLELHIVGSHPPKEITDLAEVEGVVHVGFIEDLAPLFATCRGLVVPLTWGAGVKGKVTQSLAQGLPVVTTPVGVEGLNLEHGVNVLVGATPAELCAETARLLVDDDLWSSMSKHGLALARLEYSPERLESEIATLLATVASHG